MSFIVVSASDAGYYPLLHALIKSLHRTMGRVPLRILDLGLTAIQIAELHDLGATTVIPEWDIQIRSKTVRGRHGEKISLPSTFRAFTAQPFLPKYAPGHDVIIWIDADCWVQDASFIELGLSVAQEDQLAIALEVDRSYGPPYWRLPSHFRDFIRAFGPKIGWKLMKKMTANVGVFALKTNAPHWALWQNATRRAFHYPHQRSQQMAMQYVIYINKAPAAFLPALYNWQSWEAPPFFDERAGLLVEPNPPYAPIGIMHNAQSDKNMKFWIKKRYSHEAFMADMRYETWEKDLPRSKVKETIAEVAK